MQVQASPLLGGYLHSLVKRRHRIVELFLIGIEKTRVRFSVTALFFTPPPADFWRQDF